MTTHASHAINKHLGFALILLSYLMWTLHYASAKALSTDHSVWQILFVRSVIAVLITVVVFNRRLIAPIVPRTTLMLCLIGIAQFSSAGLFYLAAKEMSLSLVTILYSVSPFVVMFLSAVFLKEKLNLFHYLSTFVGLAGILLANANSGELNLLAAIYALLSGCCWGITVVASRGFKHANPALQLLVISLLFIVLSLAISPDKQMIKWASLPTYLLLGVEVFLAQYFFLKASHHLTASEMGPFEYSSLVWSIVIDFCLFHHLPTLQILAGAGLIVLSYFFVLRGQREE